MNKPKVVKKNNRPVQNLIFKLITLVIPVFILIVFEAVLRISGYGDNLNLFVKNPTEGYDKYMIVNPVIGKKYFQKFEYTPPANDIFLAKKPENTFRIFVMGSSTVYGFPYERNLMFSRILHKQLEDRYPDKKIEVVNTAITAINSFTLLDFTGQILKYQPDAILIYAGHNEFYGAFGIGSNETMSRNRGITRLHITLMDLKIYQLIRNIISSISEKIAAGNGEEVHGTLMKRMAGNKEILYGSDEYNIAMDRYKQNMGDILKKAGKQNVHVFLSELVCNINGMEPFASIATNGLEGAAEVYKKAQATEKSGDFNSAFNLYYKAKDLDCIRFRSSEDVNMIVNELVEEYKVYRVPMLSVFQVNSPNRLIGNNLMTEHVHPNMEGNFLMADAFFNEIIRSGIVGEKNTNSPVSLDYYRKNWGYTVLDSLLAHHRVELLKGFWPFTDDESKGVNYRNSYRPKSFSDSVAFNVMRDSKLSLDEVRLGLARDFEKSGQIEKAYREYEALLRTNPYLAINYRDAANCLVQLADLPLALQYFKKSLEFEESFFATYRLGEIYFQMGDYNNAVIQFEKAFKLAPNDKKVNVLARSYASFVYGGKTGQAQAVAAELERVNAQQFLRVPAKTYAFNQYIPFQTREQVQQAKQLMAENKTDEALQLLESSLQIYDSHMAHRLIGEIYQGRQNYPEAIAHFSKVYNWFRFDPKFLHNLTLVSFALNDKASVMKYLDELKKIDPRNENLGTLNLLISSTN
ncbi:MAG: tetratricopeptide repeat protein [Bacteroidetes bacterium]|nr:MAG: tetratricopeptide repeat protein [Bacteroidota bacterium]